MTAALDLGPCFADPLEAVEEAQVLANATGWPHAVVAAGNDFQVVVDRCGRMWPVLERCWPLTLVQ